MWDLSSLTCANELGMTTGRGGAGFYLPQTHTRIPKQCPFLAPNPKGDGELKFKSVPNGLGWGSGIPAPPPFIQ